MNRNANGHEEVQDPKMSPVFKQSTKFLKVSNRPNELTGYFKLAAWNTTVSLSAFKQY